VKERKPYHLRGVKILQSATILRGLGVLLAAVVSANTGAQPPPGGVSYLSNSPVDIVVVAHQDDWQLFMGDAVARKIRSGKPVVFIYLTAGDDGREPLYWATREQGALESTRVALGLAGTDSAGSHCSTADTLRHAMRRCTILNTTSYFLRLPDGRRNGAGFAGHSYQSLRKLRGGRIASMSPVDGSTDYDSWADLTSTVAELIGESSTNRIVTIHTSDPSVVVNPHDHFDHRMAGLLVSDLRRKQKWNVMYYTGYALASRAPNRSNNQMREKTRLFAAYDRVMMQVNAKWGAYREHPAFYSECMRRTYARRVISQ
jgi:LmbE family N-acetylglucosaminyl deacetylase